MIKNEHYFLTSTLIDTHCHLDLPIFDGDRERVLHAAYSSGVSDIILPGIHQSTWLGIKQLSASHASITHLHASYGLHPMFIDKHRLDDIAVLKSWIKQERPIAIGECGLDFFVRNFDAERQLHFFNEQVKLAANFDLPLIIHSRKSLDIILKTLRKYPSSRGVIHCFSGSEQQAEQLIKLGFYLGFGGPVTYPRAKKLRHLVSILPIDHLLLETDAPDLPDVEHKGRRNEPAWLINVAQVFAELRQDSVENIARITTENTKKLFDLDG